MPFDVHVYSQGTLHAISSPNRLQRDMHVYMLRGSILGTDLGSKELISTLGV